MAVNLDKPHLWKQDTQASVDHYNKWFMTFAPKAFRETRVEATKRVEKADRRVRQHPRPDTDLLRRRPGILPTLRMSCCPPLAMDRLIGLARTGKNLVKNLEKNRLAAADGDEDVTRHLDHIVKVVRRLLDPDIFVWIRRSQEANRRRETPGVNHRRRQADRGGRKSGNQERPRGTPTSRDWKLT